MMRNGTLTTQITFALKSVQRLKVLLNLTFRIKLLESFNWHSNEEQSISSEDNEELMEDENPLGGHSVLSSGQGMTDVRLEKVGEGDFDYVLRFSLTGPNFNLTTHEDGLELSLSPVYGARFSGKTIVRYLDGTVRNGVFRIDLDLKK